MSEKPINFFPFNAINQFMLEEYRQTVLHKVLTSLDALAPERRGAIISMVKKYFKVPGFRNPMVAPLSLKIRVGEGAFERRPDFSAQVLQAWSELNPDLRQKVYEMLKNRNWELLPPEADRTKLPGFLPRWPKSENYDALGESFKAMYPDLQIDDYDMRLMAVWISTRLPFELVETEEETPEEA